MSQLEKSRAIVLTSIRWKESSKILTMYTREWGTFKVIGRGVLRKNNRLAGKVETLNLLDIIVSSKPSRSLQILTDADLIDTFAPLRTDLEKLSFALSISELILQTIEEHQADPVFFDFTQYMLTTLKTAPDPSIVFIYYLLKLTSFLGFKPNFSDCSICGSSPGHSSFYFSVEKGTCYCHECAEGISVFQKLHTDEITFLSTLQKYPHRRINEFTYSSTSKFNYIQFLIDYLSFHQGHAVKLQSLNLIKI